MAAKQRESVLACAQMGAGSLWGPLGCSVQQVFSGPGALFSDFRPCPGLRVHLRVRRQEPGTPRSLWLAAVPADWLPERSPLHLLSLCLSSCAKDSPSLRVVLLRTPTERSLPVSEPLPPPGLPTHAVCFSLWGQTPPALCSFKQERLEPIYADPHSFLGFQPTRFSGMLSPAHGSWVPGEGWAFCFSVLFKVL